MYSSLGGRRAATNSALSCLVSERSPARALNRCVSWFRSGARPDDLFIRLCESRSGGVRLRESALPSALVLLLVVAECPLEPAEHFRHCLEHGLELRLVDLVDVLAQMIDDFLQADLHLLGMVPGIAAGFAGHGASPVVRICKSPGDEFPLGQTAEQLATPTVVLMVGSQ